MRSFLISNSIVIVKPQDMKNKIYGNVVFYSNYVIYIYSMAQISANVKLFSKNLFFSEIISDFSTNLCFCMWLAKLSELQTYLPHQVLRLAC